MKPASQQHSNKCCHDFQNPKPKRPKPKRPQEVILGIVVLVLVGGLLHLALIDPDLRQLFGDLAKVTLGAYIGGKR